MFTIILQKNKVFGKEGMIIKAPFDDLDFFNSRYGEVRRTSNRLLIFLEEGLGFPPMQYQKNSANVVLKTCSREESNNVENLFPYYYIYDPDENIRCDKWEVVDGLLRARVENKIGNEEEQWIKYTSKVASKITLGYEYVGKAWLVFDGVFWDKRVVFEYTPGMEDFTERKFIEEKKSTLLESKKEIREYYLEGVFTAPPGPGWMSWQIKAHSFHIEIVVPSECVPSECPNDLSE